MKALTLLETRKSTKERAKQYSEAIKTELSYELIYGLQRKKAELESKIFDLENFDLETNLNAARTAMTQADVKARFVQLINLRYELEEVSLELEVKTEIFNEYFGTETVTADEDK